MAVQQDYYQILGVSETATTDEIKKAFRRRAKQYHPDRNPNKPQAAERFKEINEAHDVLSDPEKRKKYDRLRRYGAFAGAGSGGGTRGTPGGAGPGVEFDLSDLGSFGGLGDLFSPIFGRRGGDPRAEEDEIETAVSIPFRVAALGGRVPVTLTLPEVCPTCSGSGGAPGTTFATCPECKGRGTISLGQGGLDVIGVVPINLAQALLGSKIKVRTLDGKRVVLKVPPGTPHGQRFRIPGQGIERNGRRGDQYIEIHVEIPEHLTAEQETALKAFAEKSGMKY